MKKILKYTFRTFLAILALIVLLIVLALGISQTGFFKKKLPAIIEKQASKYLNGRLTVVKVGGNFFTELILEDVLLIDKSDTTAYIAKVEAHYKL